MANRPHQDRALNAIESNWDEGVYDQLIAMATGTGKTHVFSQLPERMKSRLPGQMIVLAHRDELLDQAVNKLRHENPTLRVEKEKAAAWADVNSDIIVASVQSVGREGSARANRFDFNKVDKYVIDEAHHSTASGYTNFLGSANIYPRLSFDNRLLVGVSASAQRSDGTPLATLYKRIVYSYGMREAIKDGWLVDVRGKRVNTRTSLDEVRSQAGDFKQDELADTVNTPERNHLILQSWRLYADNLRSIAFTVDIKHAIDLAEMFKSFGVRAEAVWGDDPQRAEKIANHKAGRLDVLFNCGILVEGYDDPQVACILMCCPTKSGVKYVQCVGRGTRLFPGKDHLLVLDFADNTRRHSLVTLPTLMGLPAGLDLDGKSLLWATEQMEKVQESFPHISLEHLSSIDNLEQYVQDVDLFTINFAPEVSEHSELTWFPYEGGYILHVPFPKEYEIDWANKPKGDYVTIKQNLLDKWEIRSKLTEWVTNRGWVARTYKAEVDTLTSAFSKGDGLIQDKRQDSLGALVQEAKWHKDKPTAAQLQRLRRMFPGKTFPADLTKGSVSRLISSRI